VYRAAVRLRIQTERGALGSSDRFRYPHLYGSYSVVDRSVKLAANLSTMVDEDTQLVDQKRSGTITLRSSPAASSEVLATDRKHLSAVETITVSTRLEVTQAASVPSARTWHRKFYQCSH